MATDSSRDSDSPCSAWLDQLGFGLPALFFLAVFLFHAQLVIQMPFQLDYGEGIVAHFSLALKSGYAIYQDPALTPFWICPYTPIFFLIHAKLIGLAGPIAAGRLLSSLATLLIVAVIYRMLARRDRGAAILAVLLFLANPLVIHWGTYCRVDSLALLFAFLGLVRADRARTEKDDRLAAGFMVLAFYTKQSYVAAPLAVMLSRWGDAKSARRFAVLYFLEWLVVFLIGSSITNGQLFALLVSRTAMMWVQGQAGHLFLDYCPFLLAPLAVVLPQFRKLPRIWVYFATLSILMILGTARFGAFFNYYLEFHLAVCVLSGLAWAEMKTKPPGLRGVIWLHVLGPGVFVSLSYLFSAATIIQEEFLPALQGKVPGYAVQGLEKSKILTEVLRLKPARIIAENVGDLTIQGVGVWYCDPSTYTGLAEQGKWDESPVLKLMEDGEIEVVVLQQLQDNARFTTAFVQTVKDHYRLVCDAGGDAVMVHRKLADRYELELRKRLYIP